MSTPAPTAPTYVDVPELAESFADMLKSIQFEGDTWRFEFVVTRIVGDARPPNPPARNQYPSCRLVLTREAGIDLLNKLTQMADAMAQQGILKKSAPMPPGPGTTSKH